MTVQSTTNVTKATGDGIQTVFAYNYLLFDVAHMYVYFDGVEQPTGWTVDGIGQQNGGNVTFSVAPADGVAIDLVRIVPLTQEIDYTEFDRFPAETHERALDLAVMRDQQLDGQQGSTLLYSANDTTIVDANRTIPPVAEMHGKVLWWEEPSGSYPNGRLIGKLVTDLGGLPVEKVVQYDEADSGEAGSRFSQWKSTDGNAFIDLISDAAPSGDRVTRVEQGTDGNTYIRRLDDAFANPVNVVQIDPVGLVSLRQGVNINTTGGDFAYLNLITNDAGAAYMDWYNGADPVDFRRFRLSNNGGVWSVNHYNDDFSGLISILRLNHYGAGALGNPNQGVPSVQGAFRVEDRVEVRPQPGSQARLIALTTDAQNAFLSLDSAGAIPYVELRSRAAAADEQRLYIAQNTNGESTFDRYTDAGSLAARALRIGPEGGIGLGSRTPPATVGHLDSEALYVGGNPVLDCELGNYAFSGNELRMQGILNSALSDRNAVEIFIPEIYTDTDGFLLYGQMMQGANPEGGGFYRHDYSRSGGGNLNSTFSYADTSFRLGENPLGGGLRARAGPPASLLVRVWTRGTRRQVFWECGASDAGDTYRSHTWGHGYVESVTDYDGFRILLSTGLFTSGTAYVKRVLS